ncbi:amidoligase family protein [Nitratiruptor sp. YY09-18]|uniref:amidoligase family protein n=1 Tax=Nitratiruptor sp. YY09-18 TaxID=2724901 RepID=UPI001914E6F2|nr:amidoligase family protein [Nitratiruptor sp. YY09-18]BCD67642.1 hypothetical protein NitYY0918_C0542 [Nitratiruptor sp. YY09-18]
MFELSPKLHNAEGKIRKAGFEIEYTGLRPLQAASIVVQHFGGDAKEIDEYETVVENTKYGKFSIYLDSVYLRRDAKEYIFKDQEIFKDLVYSLSELVVPYEIVTPPIPFTHLQEIENFRLGLKNAGALGTSASILYAFGMHINIETYSFEYSEIADILRAFVLLQDYIIDHIKVDLTRKFTWFIEPFSKEYIEHLLKTQYANFEEFAHDYIFYNPTRNRALDLLPLLLFIDQSLQKHLPPQKLSPRPAFHYRLPNSRIDEDNWNIAFEFNHWTMVEKVATNKEKLHDLVQEYFDFQETPFWFIKELWIERVEQWLKEEL